MFRIRKITNPYLPTNIPAMEFVKGILLKQFPSIKEDVIEQIGEQLVNPLKYKYQSILLLAENISETILGFALLKSMPDLEFCFLDYIAAFPGRTSSGVGGALYQRVREESESLGAIALFFECLPDDPALCKDPSQLEQSRKRLAFYERFGARPIINTKYETPVKPEDECPPFLVYDGLGLHNTVPRVRARKIVRAILERIYRDFCPEEYIRMVTESFKDDPIALRPFLYHKSDKRKELKARLSEKNRIFLISNNLHSIHHINQRGYVESPIRVPVIKGELEKTGLFRIGKVKAFPESHILKIHDKGYVSYFKRVCKKLPPGKSIYPYVFPIRNVARPPLELSVRAGYYCIDSFTPLNKNAFLAARMGVDCALTAANEILSGTRAAYVLTRPPGHHAEKNVFGGFCYFNNNAIAANFLSRYGKVAILDIDYHHGNGQQYIFYDREDVLTISIHGHPSFAYPYFSGFKTERGEGAGVGCNINYPLDEVIDGEEYRKALGSAIRHIKNFKADYLVVALGFDTAKGDPTGSWKLALADFELNGKMIGSLKLPTLIVQEGGYRTQTLGLNAKAFFVGFAQAHQIAPAASKIDHRSSA